MQAVYRAWHDACSDSGGRWECLVPGSCVMEQTFCELRWVTAGMAFGVFWSVAGNPEYKKFSDFGGRRGWYVMYKDVWKKFGVKVLIVLCSVLLIGGVAIAAPRLRAAPVNISTITIDDQTAEYQVDEAKLKVLQAAVTAGGAMPNNKIGLEQWPKSLTATIDGVKRTLIEGTDYTLPDKNNFHLSETGDSGQLKVAAVSGSALVAGSNSDYAYVQFTIVKNKTVSAANMKAELPMTEFDNANATDQTGAGNCWVVSGLPADFNASSWNMYINDAKLGKVPLRPGVDYVVENIPQATKLGGDYRAEIELINYEKK